jgi:hypothetical protein
VAAERTDGVRLGGSYRLGLGESRGYPVERILELNRHRKLAVDLSRRRRDERRQQY